MSSRQCRVSKSVNTGSRQLTILYRILKAVCLKPVFKFKYSSPPRFHKCPKIIFFQTGILNSDPTIFLHPIIFCVTQSNLSFSSLLSDKSCRQIPQILIFPNPVSKHPVGVSFDKISRKGIHRKAHNSIRID